MKVRRINKTQGGAFDNFRISLGRNFNTNTGNVVNNPLTLIDDGKLKYAQK